MIDFQILQWAGIGFAGFSFGVFCLAGTILMIREAVR